LLIAVLLRRVSPSQCWAFGIGIFALAWFVEITAIRRNLWISSSDLPLTHLNTVIDAINATELINEIGIFLIGMALSTHFQAELMTKNYRALGQRLLIYGSTAVLAALVGVVAWHVIRNRVMYFPMGPEIGGVIRKSFDPNIKDPPSPGYLLFYGGSGLLVASTFFCASSHRIVEHVARAAAVIGRASLMCFIVQDWLFFAIPSALGLNAIRSVPFWFAYLGICIAILYTLASWWGRIRGNRFFTVGLKYLVRSKRVGMAT
jgi:hypothetical protein